MKYVERSSAERQARFRKKREAGTARLVEERRGLIFEISRLELENLVLRIRYEPEKVSLWFAGWIRENKTGGRADGLMNEPNPSTDRMTFATEAAALAKCAELAAKETDSRYSYMPVQDWKVKAGSYSCGVNWWNTREEILDILEAVLREDEASCSITETSEKKPRRAKE
jgi:hypothetical protein